MRQLYCLGFAFSETGNKVLLIEKTKPDWQKGKLNGLGGHVEFGEAPVAAMVRGFKEECGLDVSSDDWVLAGVVYGPEFAVYVYTCKTRIASARSTTEESIHVYHVEDLPSHWCITNVPALVWLCRAKLEDPSMDQFDLHYK